MMRIDGITNREPTDSVFATDAVAGEGDAIPHPAAASETQRKRVVWHRFRRTFTTLLTANGENVIAKIPMARPFIVMGDPAQNQ